MLPSRTPRHAAPLPSRRRTAMVPAVLLVSVGAALGGLAVLPQASRPVAVTAAAATAPLVLSEPRTIVSNRRDLSLLDAPQAPAATRAPVRASRARRISAPPRAPEYVRPGVGRLTSGYKWRWGRMHVGIDLAGPYGSPIRAVAAGTVVEAGRESGYGYLVKVRHDDGVVTYYAHLSRIVVHGGRVQAGQKIAEEGNSGHSTGPHLHFEVRVNGNPINPIPWLASHGIRL